MEKAKVLTDVKSFTIKLSKWARGGKKGPTKLLNSNGNMCCLGFYTKACGFAKDDLIHSTSPANLDSIQSFYYDGKIKFKSKLVKYRGGFPENTEITDDLIQINDDECITDEVRQEKLKKKFAKIGVKVRFVK